MSHFAKVVNGIVVRVIVAEQDFIDSGLAGEGPWIQTSYNTHEGIHAFGGTPLRKNYAGIGCTYDAERDAFIPPKDYPSWVLNEEKCIYEAPIPRPDSYNRYVWNEETVSWDLWVPPQQET